MNNNSTNRVYRAHLVKGSPNHEQWLRVLGEGAELPLVTPLETRVNLGDEKDIPVYVLDLNKLSADQFSCLVLEVARKFDVNPLDVDMDFRRDMTFPIRSQDVFISWDARAFL